MTDLKTFAEGLKFSHDALELIELAGADVEQDLRDLQSGVHTRKSLLEHCMDGANPADEGGWRDYVSTVCDALPWVVNLVASTPSDGDRHVDPDATARPLSRQVNFAVAMNAGEAYLRAHPGAWVQVQRGEDGEVHDVSID